VVVVVLTILVSVLVLVVKTACVIVQVDVSVVVEVLVEVVDVVIVSNSVIEEVEVTVLVVEVIIGAKRVILKRSLEMLVDVVVVDVAVRIVVVLEKVVSVTVTVLVDLGTSKAILILSQQRRYVVSVFVLVAITHVVVQERKVVVEISVPVVVVVVVAGSTTRIVSVSIILVVVWVVVRTEVMVWVTEFCINEVIVEEIVVAVKLINEMVVVKLVLVFVGIVVVVVVVVVVVLMNAGSWHNTALKVKKHPADDSKIVIVPTALTNMQMLFPDAPLNEWITASPTEQSLRRVIAEESVESVKSANSSPRFVQACWELRYGVPWVIKTSPSIEITHISCFTTFWLGIFPGYAGKAKSNGTNIASNINKSFILMTAPANLLINILI
jgi:hypothetical protein